VVKELVRRFGRILRDQGSTHCVPAVTLTDLDRVTYCLTHGQPIHLCAAQDRSVKRCLETEAQVQCTPAKHRMQDFAGIVAEIEADAVVQEGD
jgi:hypothetical protein